MNLYGNEIWNNATPNSRKSVLITEKDRLDNVVKALDESGVNYCYYFKDNSVTIAIAKIAVNNSDVISLMRIPELSNITVKQPLREYTPKSSIIGRTPYRDIKNRSYQSLDTDLALKVANELEKQNIPFSGRIYEKNTVLTIDKAYRSKFEKIVKSVVSVRSKFEEKIRIVDDMQRALAADFSELQRTALKPLIDLCYSKDTDFSDILMTYLDDVKDYTPVQLNQFSEIFISTYGELDGNEYLFADTSSITNFKAQVAKNRLFDELTYLKGYTQEQKDCIRRLVDLNVSPKVIELIDYDFAPDMIMKIPEILQSKNSYEALEKFIAETKGYKLSAVHRQLDNGTYMPENARLEYYKFQVDDYSVFHIEGKGSLYEIPMIPSTGIWNRLAEHGLTPKDEVKTIIFDTDGKGWNKIVIPDRYGNKTNSIDVAEILTLEEQQIIQEVISEVQRLEQIKLFAKENSIPFSSHYSKGADEEIDVYNPYAVDGSMSFEDYELMHRMMKQEEQIDDVDKFLIRPGNEAITWMYYNPDSEAGGQFVTNEVSFDDIAKAAQESTTPTEFFDILGGISRQYLDDVDTKKFAFAKEMFENTDWTCIGRTTGTMRVLVNAANAAEEERKKQIVDEKAQHDVTFVPSGQKSEIAIPESDMSIKISKSEFIDFAVDVIRDNITVRNAHENSDKQEYNLETERALNQLIEDLTVGSASGDFVISGYTAQETIDFINEYQEDTEMQKYILEVISENVDISLTELERTKVHQVSMNSNFLKQYTSYDKIVPILEDDIKKSDDEISAEKSDKSVEKKSEKSFAEQVDEVLLGKMPFYSALKVCDTPQILMDIGCRQLPMLYTQKHLKNAIKDKTDKEHTHGLLVNQIKRLPELIENPLMIMDSLSNTNSIVIVTSEVDLDNLPVMVSVKPNGKGRYELEQLDSNFITSVYGRNNFENFFERTVRADKLLYCSKKSQSLFERWGEQYSELTKSLDFDIIIHQSRNIVNEKSVDKKADVYQKADTAEQKTQSNVTSAPMGQKSENENTSDSQISFDSIQSKHTEAELSKQKAATADKKVTDISAPTNYKISDADIGAGTLGQRFQNNVTAITLLKQIESENRSATPDEQAALARYVGWGGLAEFFKETNPHNQELRDLLTEDEYSSARATTLDSFYTSPVIIDSIYTVLQNAGFKGGNILEPSMGIGNFFGRMPQEMQEQSKLFGVEIDSLTGRIAKQLYPEAHIDIKGFEKTSFKNSSFDVAIGNIPFGDFSLQYDKQSLKIHDYFFMQALDKVKDGGIVAFVTSKGTLDKRDSSFRGQLAEKADLIGAFRLPNTAFKTAGTEVTADIIFLQKRQSLPEKMPDWVNIGVSAAGFPINEYFVQHPEMVLGKIVQGNKMYGRNDDTMCVPFENSDLSQLLPEAVSRIKAEFTVTAMGIEPIENSDVQIPENLRNYSYFEHNNNIYSVEDNTVVCLKDRWNRSYTQQNIERAKAYITVRDTVRELLKVQQETSPDTEEKIKGLQARLNTLYDSFYKKYGLLHSRFNTQLFKDDTSFPLMLSLEDKVDRDKLIRKSDIFFKRTIKVPQAVESVDTPQEALALSIAEKGRVDLQYMSGLTDIPVEGIIKELKGEIFPAPEVSSDNEIIYQTASEYLSGDIYAKLNIAKAAAERNDVYKDNISSLEAVIPTPLTAGEIDVECGAMWIPKEYYQQFMYEVFKTPNENRADCPARFPWMEKHKKNIELDYSPYTGKWYISNKSADRSVTAQKTFGTEKRNAYTIFESVLNLHIPNITEIVKNPTNPSEKIRIMDLDATKLVKKKAEAIRREFKDWIFKDPERRRTLVDLYNRQFNCIRPREFDGSAMTFPGMSSSIELHSHQKNAIAHAIHGGNTLFAHCVGAGKTFEMIATAMESKRLGLCSKSLFAVPNHLTEQVGADFMKLYPNANILVATKKDFEAKNRSRLLAKIATGNYDAVIIGHSQLGMIPISPERQSKLYKQQIADITEGIKQLKTENGESFQVKAMERTKKALQQKLEKLSTSKKDDTVYFEELGIDKLFVDEAHEFKNLMCVTKLQNISGISGRTSQRATELFMKCRYLDEKTGGKGVVFATGTPVSNSITELHTMMRYLQYDFLCQHNMQNFDNWVSTFGKQKTDYELAPTGDKFKVRTRIASYANMPELMSMFKQCADVKTSDSLKLPVPECELHVVNTEPTELQQELVRELSDRADDVQNGNKQPHEDNMLKITSDGRKVGLDPRLVNPDFEDNPQTKLNQCVNNVLNIYRETSDKKLTQIIFCDLGVPKPQGKGEKDNSDSDDNKSMAEIDSLEESSAFCVYDDIKDKLVAQGVPAKEIAFIHEAKTEAQKSELFDKVRSGEVRVLIGSTAKMGTGTNVQDRLIALHDLDVPWRPSDLEQRRGRMVRQGNINDKVHLYRYVTKGTFDAYSYQLLETKQRFISQIITSKSPARTCTDVDQEALTYSEIKALCTGDERIKEKLMLENRVKELKLFKKEYATTHYEFEDKVQAAPQHREAICKRIANIEKDFEKCRTIPLGEDKLPIFDMKINGISYNDRKEAAEALKAACDKIYFSADKDKPFPVGEIYGFKISVIYDTMKQCLQGVVTGSESYSASFTTMPINNVKKLESLVYSIETQLSLQRENLVKFDTDIASAQEMLSQPFEFEEELTEKSERLTELTDELNTEAAQRLMSGEKPKRTHYFGKEKILSSLPQKIKGSSQKELNKDKEAVI